MEPRAGSRAPAARQGQRGVRPVRGHRRCQCLHQGRGVPAGHDDGSGGQVLHRRRGAGQPGHLAGSAWVRAEVLHHRGQLRHGRQQHAGVLHSRPDQVPALHPVAEAARRQQPARPRHAVGLLDPVPGVCAPGDLPDGRSWHSTQLAADERVQLAHVHVGQCAGREGLGEVPLHQRPGCRVPHAGRGRRARLGGRGLPHPRPVRGDRPGRATRAGPSRCRSCRSRTPAPIGSTRST